MRWLGCRTNSCPASRPVLFPLAHSDRQLFLWLSFSIVVPSFLRDLWLPLFAHPELRRLLSISTSYGYDPKACIDSKIKSHDSRGRESLAQYILRSPFSQEKMTYWEKNKSVLYRAKMKPAIRKTLPFFLS